MSISQRKRGSGLCLCVAVILFASMFLTPEAIALDNDGREWSWLFPTEADPAEAIGTDEAEPQVLKPETKQYVTYGWGHFPADTRLTCRERVLEEFGVPEEYARLMCYSFMTRDLVALRMGESYDLNDWELPFAEDVVSCELVEIPDYAFPGGKGTVPDDEDMVLIYFKTVYQIRADSHIFRAKPATSNRFRDTRMRYPFW